MVLPAAVLVTSFYYSVSFTGGIIIGYIISKVFYNILVKNGKVDCIFVDFGKWKFHLHHWIIGVAILAVVWAIDYFYLSTFFTGFIFGVIIHDIYDFNDWYKVIFRNPDYQKQTIA